ncbi:thiamin pyrophosphokinase 2 [Antennarius striatus]|uniref:thiamin pyrophosphokinase 2 n=1 Tax=Antennarius striatus TaxID=241820 RepID=UPI0035B14D26
MSVCTWSYKILKLLRRMNNFYLHGSCRADFARFEISNAKVGWVHPRVSSLLTQYPDVFIRTQDGTVTVCDNLDSYTRRSEAVDDVLQALRQEGSLICLEGWRDEKSNVMPKFGDRPLMWMERAATSVFGVKQYGVHINGYTVSGNGHVCMWLARRSYNKQTYAGLLDHVAAGSLAAGDSIKQTVVKECLEEACIPVAIAEKAQPVSTVSYTHVHDEEVFAKSLFTFDLELPMDFKPKVGDGEVQDFYLLPIDKVKELVATGEFKPNCAMVVLDFLIRHSFIDPDIDSSYQDFVTGLHQTLE